MKKTTIVFVCIAISYLRWGRRRGGGKNSVVVMVVGGWQKTMTHLAME